MAENIKGYNLWVDDDFQAGWMEEPTNLVLELIKLVDVLGRPHVPQHTVVQHQLVRGVKGRTVVGVVVAQLAILQGEDELASSHIVYLAIEKKDYYHQHKIPLPAKYFTSHKVSKA